MDQAIVVLKALSDKNRLRIIKMLQIKPMCVCEIREVLGLANSTTSKHLSILKSADLIFEKRENKWINYYLNQTTQQKYSKEMLELIEKWIENDPLIINDRTKVEGVDRFNICNR